MQYNHHITSQLFLQPTLFCQSVFLSGSLAYLDCKPLKKEASCVTPAVLAHSLSLNWEPLVNFHSHDSIDYIRQVLIKRWLRRQVQPPSTVVMYIIIWVAAYALRPHNNQRWSWSYFGFYSVYVFIHAVECLQCAWSIKITSMMRFAIWRSDYRCILLIIFQWISWSGPKSALTSFHRLFFFLSVKL